jgi:hypothetical protein
MTSHKLNRIAQSILLTAWAIIIVLNYPSLVSSQECVQPTYSHPSLHVNSWVRGLQVTVQIDQSFSSDERSGLKAGNEAWNNPTLIVCSGVRFLQYDVILVKDYNATPPANHLVAKG